MTWVADVTVAVETTMESTTDYTYDNGYDNGDTTIEEETPDFTLLYFIKAIAFFLITVGTVLGNSFVIIAVVYSKRLANTFPGYFVVNLAVTDLIVGIYVIPLNGVHSALGYFPFNNHGMCVFTKLITLLSCVVSIFSLCLLALDRYILVTHPLTYKTRIMTRKMRFCLIGIVWLIGFLCLFGVALTFPILTAVDPVCKQKFMMKPAVSLYFVCWFTTSFILMFTLHWFIYRRLADREKNISKGIININTIVGSESGLRIHVGGHTYSSAHSSKLELHTQTKVAKTLTLIFGVFFMSWLPYVIFLCVCLFGPEFKFKLELANIIASVGYFNSCMNPFIYAARSNSFRTAFKKLLMFKKEF